MELELGEGLKSLDKDLVTCLELLSFQFFSVSVWLEEKVAKSPPFLNLAVVSFALKYK